MVDGRDHYIVLSGFRGMGYSVAHVHGLYIAMAPCNYHLHFGGISTLDVSYNVRSNVFGSSSKLFFITGRHGKTKPRLQYISVDIGFYSSTILLSPPTKNPVMHSDVQQALQKTEGRGMTGATDPVNCTVHVNIL